MTLQGLSGISATSMSTMCLLALLRYTYTTNVTSASHSVSNQSSMNTTAKIDSRENDLLYEVARVRWYSKNKPLFQNILEIITLLVIIITSLAGNGALVYTVFKEDKFRTPTNCFVISQCLADIGMTLTVMLITFIAICQRGWKLHYRVCVVQTFCNRLFLSLTILTFALISIDRYMVIVASVQKKITTNKAFLVCILLWVEAVTTGLPWEFLTIPRKIGYDIAFSYCVLRYVVPASGGILLLLFIRTFLNALIPLLVILYCFYNILKAVRTHRRKVGPAVVSNWRKITIDAYSRSAYTSILVLVSFLICFIPFIVAYTLLIAQIEVPETAMTIFKFMYWSNAAIKPVLYITRSPQWLKKVRRLLFCMGNSRKPPKIITYSPAARRSAKYAVPFNEDQHKRNDLYKRSCSSNQPTIKKRLTPEEFNALFTVQNPRSQAWM